MARTIRRYAIHLLLLGGQREMIHFRTLEAFQQWYGSVLTASAPDAFVNVPIGELEGEYLVVRPSAVIGIRVEPQFGSVDD
ncbi:hypothetical protein [Synechococcus sp. CS-1328]|uniref:hypothetical protein n=1 Tax=Synechococcus sp. CS-1328 TaxID=2847976 RepID=UPI00223B1652|nr:hypothetical protein [Synechococcus sp. CS-1328]MCT0225937.1 hypothetical protein [Synechococcus sp. CS-1328]